MYTYLERLTIAGNVKLIGNKNILIEAFQKGANRRHETVFGKSYSLNLSHRPHSFHSFRLKRHPATDDSCSKSFTSMHQTDTWFFRI